MRLVNLVKIPGLVRIINGSYVKALFIISGAIFAIKKLTTIREHNVMAIPSMKNICIVSS